MIPLTKGGKKAKRCRSRTPPLLRGNVLIELGVVLEEAEVDDENEGPSRRRFVAALLPEPSACSLFGL